MISGMSSGSGSPRPHANSSPKSITYPPAEIHPWIVSKLIARTSIVGSTLTVTDSIGKGRPARPSEQLFRAPRSGYDGFMRRHFLSVLGVACTLLLLPLAAEAQTEGLAKVSAKLNQSALRPGDEAVLAVVVDIAEGYHSQSDQPLNTNFVPFAVKLDPNAALEVKPPLYAKGHIEEYPALGRLSVYTGRVVTYVPVRVKPDASPGQMTIAGTVYLQICDDQICYLPEEIRFALPTQIVAKDVKVELAEPEFFAEYAARRSSQTSPTAAPATQRAAGPTMLGDDGAAWSTPFAFGAAFL